ncbi:NAD(P)/FAD-dependent oxidoreductase [Nocardia caishijiensis]|uniref:Thioredoxin reductase (NADPH) n=1 Tax=Nocardia caishijiensis TaxID=184756 RepID=A0ABQ6YP57_9NOCA|nr:FAD-dependent oxidoreductase [Nocardia caishijiensis]KAF0847553.1 thioredoxin reductase (NADPH) [Nocardia caishijiensis]
MAPTSPDEPGTPALTVVGDLWSPACAAIRTFLRRNDIDCRWVRPDDPEGRRLLTAHGFDTGETPVLIDSDGRALRPTDEAQLARWVGLHTAPSSDDYDLVIVGGGPAGMAAAVYGASEGLRTVALERWAIGGQAGLSSRIENYLGFPDGISGAQLTDRARRQAGKFGAELVISSAAEQLAVTANGFTVRCSGGLAVSARSVIVATGATFRTLDAPGIEQFAGRGVYYFSALTEAPLCTGSVVYIVGGANSAGQAAIYFAETATRVIMLVRGPSLAAEMSAYLVEQIRANPRIEVRTDTEIAAAAGETHLAQLTLRDRSTGELEQVPATWVFAFIGADPATAWLGPAFARDTHGYLLTGPDIADDSRRWPLRRPPLHLETTVPGVFAAGDVRAFTGHRVAAAVGEGSMAVMLVHKFLHG